MSTKNRDPAGARAAFKISAWIESWGDSRFPIDVDLLAKNCHTTYGRDDPITQIHGADWKDIDGFLKRNPENTKEWWITYNTNSTPERQRFTKAHELGHYIMHSQKQDTFRCGRDAMSAGNADESNIEVQANQFASHLLMPSKHVCSQMANKALSFSLVSELAKYYGTSFESMCIRATEVTSEKAILVNWDNGFKKRCVRSESAKLQRLWIQEPKDGMLEPTPGTLAADPDVRQCLDGRPIPANLWFKNAPPGLMLREMKHTSDAFERVLSLLIVPQLELRSDQYDDEYTSDSFDHFIQNGQPLVR